MPRQPYPRSYLKPIYGLAHPEYMTKMAEGVGRCIMLFSYVDWQMALVLAAIMKADSEASVAIFLSLRNTRAQRDVLIAASDRGDVGLGPSRSYRRPDQRTSNDRYSIRNEPVCAAKLFDTRLRRDNHVERFTSANAVADKRSMRSCAAATARAGRASEHGPPAATETRRAVRSWYST